MSETDDLHVRPLDGALGAALDGALEAAVQGQRGDVEQLLIELCRSSSPSHDSQGLRRTAELIVSKLEPLGLETRLGEDLVVAATSVPGTDPQTGAPLFVVGHYDTVLAAREPERGDGRLMATGAVDMKGGIAVFLGALAALRHIGADLPALRLAFVPDEEIGGPLSAEAVRHHGAEADEMWVLEPGLSRTGGTRETVVLGRWGLATWQLNARGTSAHSGLDFEQGRSALWAAARWVDRAQGLSEADRASVNTAVLRCPDLTEPGNAGEPPLNVVPDRASIRGEIRFANDSLGEDLIAQLRQLTETVAQECDVSLTFSMDEVTPAYSATDLESWWPRLESGAAKAGLELEPEHSRRGVSFSNFLPRGDRAAPIRVLDGLGPVGGGMHTKDEWVSLESIHLRTRWLARLLLEKLEPAR